VTLVLAAQLFGLAVVLASVVVLVTNMHRMLPMEVYPAPERYPRASILVPARDEERGIEQCVRSLLAQTYPGEFELRVLDDGSTDATPGILARLAAEDARLQVTQGEPLPDGWLGKPWACAQLEKAASGEVLLFTDADTHHRSHSLRAGVDNLMAERADLLTGLPHVETATWGELLLLPAVPWSTVTLLPLLVAYHLRLPSLAAANGQYLLFRREAYDAVGGHAAVRGEIVEDLMLAQRVKAAGLTWRLADVSDLMSTRMYRGLSEAFSGLGKNLWAAFGWGVARYLLAWPLLVVIYLLPTIVLLAAALGHPVPGASVPLAGLTWLVTAGQFAGGYYRFDYPPTLALLHPVTMTLLLALMLWSVVLSISGRATWKGRRLVRPPLRWL
jgi:chlorobactene glucosyltransferase